MTDLADGGHAPPGGFKDRVQEVLMRLKAEDPATGETVRMAAEVAASAEEEESPYWAITMKYFYLSALQSAGRIDEAMMEFPKFLSYYDRNPGGNEDIHLLTAYKWVLYDARLFPQISKEKIKGLMSDFEGRLRRAGRSLRPLHQAQMNWAVTRGHAEEAARHFIEWQAAQRDSVSDCPACELHDRVGYLVHLGQDDEAIRAAAPLLKGDLKCSSVPDRTYGALLTPLLRIGRREEAVDLHWLGHRRIAGKRRYVDAAAQHLAFLVKAGELEEATRLFESFVPLALEATTPFYRFTFLLSGWLLLERLCAAGSNAAGLNLPASLGGVPSGMGYDLHALRDWFRNRTQELAQSFDERDETDAHSRKVASTIAG